MARAAYVSLLVILGALAEIALLARAQLGCPPLLMPVPGMQVAGAFGEVFLRGYDPKMQQARAAPLLSTCSGNNTFLDLGTNSA